MAVDVIDAFFDAACTNRISETDDADPWANPIVVTLNADEGSTVETEIYIKNVSSDVKVTDVQATIVNPSSAITYELCIASSNDASGTPTTYQSPPISLPDLNPGDVVKIFLKQTVAPGTPVQKITSHSLSITGTAVPV